MQFDGSALYAQWITLAESAQSENARVDPMNSPERKESNFATRSAREMPRREFIQLAGAAAAAGIVTEPLRAAAVKKLDPLPPGIKVSLQISTDATSEDLQFARQLGVDYVNIPTGGR